MSQEELAARREARKKQRDEEERKEAEILAQRHAERERKKKEAEEKLKKEEAEVTLISNFNYKRYAHLFLPLIHQAETSKRVEEERTRRGITSRICKGRSIYKGNAGGFR